MKKKCNVIMQCLGSNDLKVYAHLTLLFYIYNNNNAFNDQT